jgi:hypothetical protein
MSRLGNYLRRLDLCRACPASGFRWSSCVGKELWSKDTTCAQLGGARAPRVSKGDRCPTVGHVALPSVFSLAQRGVNRPDYCQADFRLFFAQSLKSALSLPIAEA